VKIQVLTGTKTSDL